MDEENQTTEVRQTNEQVGNTTVQRENVTQKTEVSGVVILQRVIYYIGGVLMALLLIRIILQLLGANENSGFVSFIYGISGVFVAPFNGIFGEPTFGQSHFDTSALVAFVVYGLVVIGIAKLVTLTRPQQEI